MFRIVLASAFVFCQWADIVAQVHATNEAQAKNNLFTHNGGGDANAENRSMLPSITLEHMASQQRASQNVEKTGCLFGDVSVGISRHLICDLLSPITIGSEQKFELVQHRAEIWEEGTKMTYRWTITENDSGNIIHQETTDQPKLKKKADTPGKYKIEVLAMVNDAPTNIRITMNQWVIPEDSVLTVYLDTCAAEQAKAYREIVNDFKTYIIDAANETGRHGISPRFLAAVLLLEIYHRPKEKREREIECVTESFAILQRERWLLPWQKVDRSVGVGQIRLSTLAMTTGKTPWIDQHREDRKRERTQTEKNFEALRLDEKIDLFRLLKRPKSSISMTAKLLTRLKNRDNRYPAFTRRALSLDQHAASIISTEYNIGPSNSPSAEAMPSWHGEQVWEFMNSDKILIRYFPDS